MTIDRDQGQGQGQLQDEEGWEQTKHTFLQHCIAAVEAMEDALEACHSLSCTVNESKNIYFNADLEV